MPIDDLLLNKDGFRDPFSSPFSSCEEKIAMAEKIVAARRSR